MILTIFAIFPPTLRIMYMENPDSLDSTEINPLPAATRLNIGAWIIIAGDRESDHALVECIKKGSDLAYFILVSRDVDADDIKYLGPDWATPGTSCCQDDVATLTNIEDAITNWAASRVGPGQALGIYLFDHGGTNKMAIPGPNLADTTLNTWLDELEASTGCNRMIIIYEACHAGSFINPISKHNRIVIASTDSAGGASVTSDLYWAWFSKKFFSSIVECKTIGECFEDAVAYVEAVGAVQTPWIDDNHDETGHEVDTFGNLPNGGDGTDALNYWIGTGSTCPITLLQGLPLKAYVSIETSITPMWVVVENDSRIEKVYVRVIPPDWVPPELPPPDDSIAPMIHDGLLPQYLYDPDGDGNFTGNIYLGRNLVVGDYRLIFHASSEDGTVADIESTFITLNNDGKAPTDIMPPTITITNPHPANVLKGAVEIIAEGDDDQALDKIQIYIDAELVKEESMPPYYPYPEVIHSFDTSQYSNGAHVITAIAIDKANNNKSTTVTVIFSGTSIPSYNIPILMFGSVIGVILVYLKKIKKRQL